jgi:hypothetical protein
MTQLCLKISSTALSYFACVINATEHCGGEVAVGVREDDEA